MRRNDDTGSWLVLAGFGLAGVGFSLAVRYLATLSLIPAGFQIGDYTTDSAWPRGVYADAALGVTLSGLLAGGLVLLLHRWLSRTDHRWGRRLQLGAILLICLGLLGLVAMRCFWQGR